MVREAQMYGRFLLGLRGFLRNTFTLEQARERTRGRLERRSESLLRMAERGVFGLRTSPYRELLHAARCELGDFVALVRDRGVEGALLVLREAGIYFTFEEFKGRKPVVRDGREIPITPGQFDNPYLSHYYGTQTGGSTGKATRVSTDLEHLALQAEHRLLCVDAHGVSSHPCALWRPPLPSGSGINQVLLMAHWGRPPERWFTPLIHSDFRPSLKFRLANDLTIALGRTFGAELPWPEPVALNRATRIAEWMRDTCKTRGGAVLNTTVSNGARIAVAALDADIDLTGTWLFVAGEPATPAKVARILSSGARIMTDYGAAEMGRIGIGCPHRASEGDVHVLDDMVGLIGYPREVSSTGETVHSYHVTTLSPAAPKLLLNVEFDDCGVIDERPCGCPLGELGLSRHLREIRSFGKLVGEGVSLLTSEMEQVLEGVLPSRFGGSLLDYQLEESEDENGLTRLTLLVSPGVDLPAESEVIGTLLEALSEVSAAADVASAFWKQGETLRVRRSEPYRTSRGKQPLLHKRTNPAGGIP